MVEILGNNLKKLFDVIDNPPKDAEITYTGNIYEVWEISDELHKKMCDMSEEEFVKLAGGDAWWRSSDGSDLGIPDTKFVINGEEIIAWNTEEKHENFQYDYLSDYIYYGVGTSDAKYVCAYAIDLAKYNDMTMGELFEKYEG